MIDPDKHILACVRVQDMPADRVVKGSVVRRCAGCEVEVWIAPSGLNTLERHNAQPLCHVCAVREQAAATEKGEQVVTGMTMESLREAEDHLKRGG